MMKILNIILSVFFLAMVTQIYAQKLPGIDKSTLDMSYLPHNYPHDGGDGPVARVIYSRPSKNGREIFGKLVPFGKVWRVGANEATEIQFFQDVSINGNSLKAGTYSLFAVPGEKQWEIIFSNMRHVWGAYSYDESKDELRVNVAATNGKKEVENLTIMFSAEGKSGKGNMAIYWDKTVVEVPIDY